MRMRVGELIGGWVGVIVVGDVGYCGEDVGVGVEGLRGWGERINEVGRDVEVLGDHGNGGIIHAKMAEENDNCARKGATPGRSGTDSL